VRAALKLIMTVVGLLLIGTFVALILLFTQFEELLRDGLTHQAGRILKCEVRLEGVRVDWTQQALVFKGFTLFNPEGFTDREALRIGTMTVKPEALSIFSKTPGVSRITVDDVRLHLQYKAGSGTNIGGLSEHARDWAEKQEVAEESVWGRRFKLKMIESAPIVVKIEGLIPPTPVVSLESPAFTVDAPGGGAAITGAKATQLLFRGMLGEIRRLDGVVDPLRGLLGVGAA
jgi:hypothetical protein